ncbi:3-hydroxyacyl-CoA dehydrogenase family protein [Thermoflexus sp.]|uniref:3-hydroxyacyl-CoA dehydrogenase family protein n=1 Tax=Thermoflexus sp. TaxID=1969742 RepID=UPI0035E41F68
MNIQDVRTIGVVGCGLMGSGIAEVCARAGFQVIVREVNPELLRKGLDRIRASMAKAVERGKLRAPDMEAAWGRIRGTLDMTDFGACDLVIEAVVEDMNTKKEVFADLDRICPPHAVLASNTSSLSITELGSVTRRPEQVIGFHFFNPVPVMPLLEIVVGLKTSEETVALGRALAERLNKTVVISKDRPGFIVNRLLIPYLLDAIRLLEEGVATMEDIDTAIRLGLNHPMGPFTLMDFVGLDTLLFIADAMFEELKDPRYAAPPLLRRMVAAGWLGRKSGRGFYTYPA